MRLLISVLSGSRSLIAIGSEYRSMLNIYAVSYSIVDGASCGIS